MGRTPRARATSVMARISPTHVPSTKRSATTILTPGATLVAKRRWRWVRTHIHTNTRVCTEKCSLAWRRHVRASSPLAVRHPLSLFYLRRPPLLSPGLLLPSQPPCRTKLCADGIGCCGTQAKAVETSSCGQLGLSGSLATATASSTLCPTVSVRASECVRACACAYRGRMGGARVLWLPVEGGREAYRLGWL